MVFITESTCIRIRIIIPLPPVLGIIFAGTTDVHVDCVLSQEYPTYGVGGSSTYESVKHAFLLNTTAYMMYVSL